MLQHFVRRRVKPLVLGIDWQVDELRIVLLACANKTNKTNKTNETGWQRVLGQWHLSLPLLSVSATLQAHSVWRDFIAQLALLLGSAPLHVNVGIPNRLCTWLHCPADLFEARTNLVTLQLHYQRMAAAALNIEPVNLRVCHLQLSSKLSFLVVTKRHYGDHIGQLISSVHDAIEGSVVGRIEPQGLTKVWLPEYLDDLSDEYAMAWFMANKIRVPTC